MMSIQILTRNLRRVATLRGFGSASVIEKPEATSKSQNNTKQVRSKNSVNLFEKLKSLDQTVEVAPKQNGDRSSSSDAMQPQEKPNEKGATARLNIDSHIANATTVSELLKFSEKSLNHQIAMKILTKLSAWTASEQVNIKNFENDYRFLKICRILSKMPVQNNVKQIVDSDQQKSAELEIVLTIAGDDEAMKIIGTLSLPQQVKVFSSFARKKTRSIEVLKALASNISECPDKMNLKECSDLLFAMTTLNFIDDVLLCRIGIDINAALSNNVDKVAVVGSIMTSLGFLKYKETTLLDNLAKWIVNKRDLCRTKDLASLVMTLALVNYQPSNVSDLSAKVISKITRDDLSANEWLDFVWALSVLELQQAPHLVSILRPDFLTQLTAEQGAGDVLPAQKMKLLNINAVAKYLGSNYDGPFLNPESSVNNCPFGYRKSKKVLIQGLLDTLKNLFNENSHVRTEYDTKLGFVIDAECVFNENGVPLAVESDHKDAIRVALMVLDYHDMCKGSRDPNGFNALAFKLLEKIGYTVLPIPHAEFSTRDKVLTRVQYIDSKLKNMIKQSSKSK